MIDPALYISRPETQDFYNEIKQAIAQPQSKPLVFQVCGVGGVGKTTLLARIAEVLGQEALSLGFGFGKDRDMEAPLKLMKTLYDQLPDLPRLRLGEDSFLSLYRQHEEALHELQNQPADGKKAVDGEQRDGVKKLLGFAIGAAEYLGTPKPVTEVAKLAVKDDVVQLLQAHRITKRNKQLQELLLDPLRKLTAAFVKSLVERAKQKPILLLLDVYEKAPPEVDAWLRRFLLSDRTLRHHPIRLVLAGRQSLLNLDDANPEDSKTESWYKWQQDDHLLRVQPLPKFDRLQTQEYLEKAGLRVDFDQVYDVTRGLPYYLGWIQQELRQGRSLDFAQAHRKIETLLLQGCNATQKQLIELAACCRWFDYSVIQYLTQQFKLPDEDGFKWLTQQALVEPVQYRYRLDDVARDVFCRSLWETDRPRFERIHDALSRYFKAQSDQAVPAHQPPPAKYNNPDWQQPRAEFLYYLAFTRQPTLQLQWRSHLLEARHFAQDQLVQLPLRAIAALGKLDTHPFLSYTTRQFLSQIRPAVEQGWAVLEKYPIDYPYNQENHALSQSDTDTAIRICLDATELQGLAKFVALFYKSKRCPPTQQLDYLRQARTQAEQIIVPTDPNFSSGLFLWQIGNALYNLKRYEEAIESYDQAIAIKPDFHEAWYNRGIALSDLGRYEEAIASYERAVAIKPDDHEAWNNRGNALSILERYEEAIASCDRSLEFLPDYAGAYYNKACCYGLQGDVEQASENLRRATELYPECREMAKTDTDFDRIREDDRFREIIRAS